MMSHEKTMTEEEINKHFYDRADEIIEVANNQVKAFDVPKVSASTQFAAARFNAFCAARYSETKEELVKHKSEAIDFFTSKYRDYFTEHLEDYIENYDDYIDDESNS